jgi:hypothetical protein
MAQAVVSPEANVSRAQSLERRTIRSDCVCIERIRRRDEAGVILAHPSRCPALQDGAPPRLGKV